MIAMMMAAITTAEETRPGQAEAAIIPEAARTAEIIRVRVRARDLRMVEALQDPMIIPEAATIMGAPSRRNSDDTVVLQTATAL